MKQFIVGITGATGSIYGVRLVEELIRRDYRVFLTVTRAGQEVMGMELGIGLSQRSVAGQQGVLADYLTEQIQAHTGRPGKNAPDSRAGCPEELPDLREWVRQRLCPLPIEEIGACIASGSFLTEGMAVVPCSMATLSGIAHGRSGNLLERAADVMLKEGRPLLVAPREMPLSTIHLENMLALSRLGAAIVPPMPGFYHRPQCIDDLVCFVVGKILDRLRIPHALFQRWEGQQDLIQEVKE